MTGVDSIMVNGSYRKVFNCQDPVGMVTELIEGIGANTGFLEHMSPVLECGWTFDCFAVSQQAYWPDSTVSCDLSVGVNEYSIAEFKTYPNPAKSEFNIEIPNRLQIKNVKVYNSSGQEQSVQFKKLNGKIVLNVETLKRGFYLVSLDSDYGQLELLKLLKQ